MWNIKDTKKTIGREGMLLFECEVFSKDMFEHIENAQKTHKVQLLYYRETRILQVIKT